MKDAFGREIRENDVIVYSTRSGSHLFMNVARVLKAQPDKVKVRVLAGTGYAWSSGRFAWNEKTKSYETTKYEGYDTTLHASRNIVISNGIDAAGIHASVMQKQRTK